MTAAERGAGAQETRLVALAGNPNVGKSTIFNALTGMHQHTGNWPGKTVALAQGTCRYKDAEIRLVDLPGTYALVSKSQEEALAAGFVSGGEADCVITVCDATSLERSLILALQVLELTDRAFVCVNLMDEAQKQGIRLDLAALSFELGVPVVAVSAGREEGMQELLEQLRRILDGFEEPRPRRLGVIDASVRGTQAAVLALQGGSEQASDAIASRFVRRAEEIAGRVVCEENEKAKARAVRADRMLTGRFTGGLLLGALLGLVFWLTIQGANVPSALLQRGFDAVEGVLWAVADSFHAPSWLSGALIAGVYQTTAKVVSVMLPPWPLPARCLKVLNFAALRVCWLTLRLRKASACPKFVPLWKPSRTTQTAMPLSSSVRFMTTAWATRFALPLSPPVWIRTAPMTPSLRRAS